MSTPSTRNPLAPLEFVLAFGTGFFVLVMLLVAGAATFGSGSFDTDVCVSISNGTAATVSDEVYNPAQTAAEAAPGQQVLSVDTTVLARRLDVCARNPTTAEKVVNAGEMLMGLLALGVPVALAWRLVRTAKVHGIYSAGVARMLTVLGFWVLVSAAIFSIAVSAADNWLLSQMLPYNGSGFPLHVPWSWGTLLTGFGLLSLGRVMANAVAMQDELDATV